MPHYSENELLQSLRECKKKYGEVNTRILNEDDDFPTGPTYGYRFDSFSDALEKAGLNYEASKARRRTKKTPYTEDEIISHIKDISEDGLITNRMIVTSDGPSVNTVLRVLSIDNINEIEDCVSDISVTAEWERHVEDKSTVRNKLLTAAEENGKITKSILDRDDRYPSIDDINYHYGSLEGAANELGINIHRYEPIKSIESALNSVYIYVVERNDTFIVNYTTNITENLPRLSEEFDGIERIVRVKDNTIEEMESIVDELSKYGYNVEYERGREFVQCDNCEERFSRQSHKLKTTEKNFCSRECKDNHGKEYRECVTCGDVKRVAKSSYIHNNGWVCSVECNYEKYRDVVECIVCGEKEEKLKSEINYNSPHFCSLECSKEYNHVDTVCENCGDTMTVRRGRFEEYDNHYCDLDCLHESVNGKGESNYDAELQIWARDVKQRESYTCEDCGESYSVMTAHHEPPKSELTKEEALNPENGLCLCYPCHAEKHTGNTKEILYAWWDWYTTEG